MKLSEASVRQEVKYKIFIRDLPVLHAWIYSQSHFRKSYNNRGVNSVYYDTPNYDFAASNMSGESQRIKIRARWYSPLGNNVVETFCASGQEFIFEVKRKINSFSDKLIIGKTDFTFEESIIGRLSSLTKSLTNYQTELPYISNFNLHDVVILSYEREYYEDSFCKTIRLTIDKNIHFRKSRPLSSANFLSRDYVIAELKFKPDDCQRVESLMRNFPFRRVRSSKYIAAMSQLHRVSY
ncbi:VTC domain-containing protein [Oceanospirillaceae bacterium]|nr:VTC domain-containing protein [Oceanospirillaceae bacterium]